jgi:anti-sigma B factor antagonist
MKEGDMSVSVSTRSDGDAATVVVAGDVDLASAPSVDAAIEAAIGTAGPMGVVVDLSQVTFLDSSGISALLRGRRLADEGAVAYRVIGAQGLVLTVLEMTGVWPHLSRQDG